MTSRALSSASSSRIHRSSATEPKRSSASTLFTLIVSISLTTAAVGAQTLAEVTERVRNYRSTHERAILLELSDLVSIPNFAEDAEQIRRNATHLTQELERRGIEARLLESQGSPPAVYGWLPATKDPATAATVVFYAHYDGQPVDLERWWSPPYEAQLRRGTEKGAAVVDIETTETFDPEWRIYGRSASDDKSPIVAMMAAIDALAASGIDRSVNLKFFLEGEEERGSPHLGEMLRAHRDLLDADLWLFCDGPVHQSREPQVVFGVRGVMGVGVTLYGPNRPLHSGHYGNWAPNPAARLAELIASMRDGEGAILIDGFYDRVRPLTASDRAAIDAAPPIDDELRIELDLARTESNNAPLLERIMLPALNVQGLAAGGVGDQAANAVPSEARAALGFRLVPDLLPEDVKRLVEAHLRGLGYEIVYQEPTAEQKRAHARLVRLDWEDGYRASRASLDGPAAEALLTVVDQIVAAQSKLRGSGPDRVLRLPILGGSLPLYLFDEILGTPLIVLPMVNHDNSQHAPNENVRLQNLWDGIELYAGVIAGLGEVWKGSPNASLSSPNPAGSQTTPADTQTRWPQFRGAQASGVAAAALPTRWDGDTGEHIAWKAAIPGLSHSSPIVWEDRIYVSTAVGGKSDADFQHGLYGAGTASDDRSPHRFVVMALDARTGSVEWETTVHQAVPSEKRHIKATYNNQTPATNGEVIVAFFGSEGLFALDLEGNVLWRKDVGRLDVGAYDAPTYEWGSASSPIIWGDLAIIQCDTQGEDFLMAVDLRTGEERWRTEREEVPSWGTPTALPATPSHPAVLVVNGGNAIIGYDPATGVERWRLGGSSPITAPTPIAAGDDLIVIASGRRPTKPIYVVRRGAHGDITPAAGETSSESVVWSVQGRGPYMPTPIVAGDRLFVLQNEGILDAYVLETGEEIYRQRLRHRGGGFSGSPVIAGDLMFISGEDGDVFVIDVAEETRDTYREVAVNSLGERIMSTPAIAHDTLYIKGDRHLFAIRRAAKVGATSP